MSQGILFTFYKDKPVIDARLMSDYSYGSQILVLQFNEALYQESNLLRLQLVNRLRCW